MVFHVHGNRASEAKATKRGMQTYDRTFLEWKDAPPVRFVIFTWPSDQIKGAIRDVREKAARADQHVFHLARLLTRLGQYREVSLIGYSYGGRLSLNAVHLASGGAICGKKIATNPMKLPSLNLILLAPAIRNDCFHTSRTRALDCVNSVFLLYNSQDQLLKYFRYAKFDCERPALGFTGAANLRQLPVSSDWFKQFNASQNVGADHDYLEYIADKRIEKMVQDNLFSPGRSIQRNRQVIEGPLSSSPYIQAPITRP
jgi:esterase/lipase superfamily enzyme